MKKFQKFEFHDYMDMRPRTEIRACSKEQATAYIAHMKERWHSGTSKYIGEMSAKEAFEHVVKTVIKEMKNPQPDTDEFIKNLTKQFVECYCKED